MRCNVRTASCGSLLMTFALGANSFANARVNSWRTGAQEPLQALGDLKSNGVARLPIESQNAVFFQLHKTNISIGTPPKNFSIALDTGSDGPFFVPSVGCLKEGLDGCDDQRIWPRLYNHSSSASYQSNGSSATTEWAGVNYDGFISYDNIRLGDFEVEYMVFEEWEQQNCRFVGCIRGGFDGVLPLAPPWSGSAISSPLNTLVGHAALNADVFSLRLPNAFDSEGELVLGSRERPVNTGNPKEFQVRDPASLPDYLQPLWTIHSNGFRFRTPVGDDLNLTYPNFTAIIASAFPNIMLPERWATTINALIGATEHFGPFNTIACEKRGELPSLSVYLGTENETLTISSWDYVQEICDVPEPGAPCFCASMLEDAVEYGFGEKAVALGSAFMSAFHTTFDIERRSVSFAKLEYDAS